MKQSIFYLLLLAALSFASPLTGQTQPNDGCGTVFDNETIARMNAAEPAIQQYIAARKAAGEPDFVADIKVKMYIVRQSNGTGGLATTSSFILSNLNSKFGGTVFSFSLCGSVEYIDDSALYNADHTQPNALLSAAYTPGALNMYFTPTISGKAGYAPLPNTPNKDFVVIRNDAANTSTVPHEVGHFFGLYHTHGKGQTSCSTTDEWANKCNCQTAGDNVCDTPADPNLYYSCSSSVDSCKYSNTTLVDANQQAYVPMVSNLMSYAPDICRTQFTPGQKERMAAYYQVYRSYLSCSAACAAPSSVSAIEITHNSMKINWPPVVGASTYEVQYKKSNQNWDSLSLSPSTSLSVQLNNLAQATTYTVRVRSICPEGPSAWKEGTFNTYGAVNTPTNLVVTGLGANYVSFGWSAVSGATMYYIEIRSAGAPYWTKSVFTSSTSLFFSNDNTWTHIFPDNGLASNQPYEWRIRAYNSSSKLYSAWSSPQPFTTLPLSCNSPQPAQLVLVSATSSSITVKCTTPGVSFSFRGRQMGGGPTSFQTNFFSTNIHTFDNLDACSVVQVQCKVRCQSGGSWSTASASQFFTTTGCAPCTTPTGLITSSTTHNSATITWSSVAGSAGYNLQWRKPNEAWTDLPGTMYTTNWTVYNLLPNQSYRWRVRSLCPNTQQPTAWSGEVVANTTVAACGKPLGLKIIGKTQDSVTFAWHAPSGTSSFTLQYQTSGGAWKEGQITGEGALVSGLSAGTFYNWRLRTNCAAGQSSVWQTGPSFTTLPANNLSASPAAQNVNYNAGSIPISVTSNTGWAATVVPGSSWLTLGCTAAGQGNGPLTANFTANTGTNARTATVNITGGGITRTVSITQAFNPNPNCTNDSEPANNTLANAPTIAFNTNKLSQVGTNGDEDIWKFILPSAQNVTATMTTLPADYELKLYNSTGAQIGVSALSGLSNESIALNNLAAGTYYAKVYGFNGANSPTQCYTLKVATSAANALTISPTAKTVGAGAGSETFSVASNVSWMATDDAAWLTLSPASGSNDGTLTASFSANTGSNARTATITVTGGGITRTATITQAFSSNPNCSNDSEPANNTVPNAPTLALNTDKLSQIGSSSDEDIYKFILTSTQNLTATLTTLPGDYDLQLYNSAVNLIETSESSGTSNESIVMNGLAAGTYYLRVYGYNGANSLTQCYTLRAATSATNTLTLSPTTKNVGPSAGSETFTVTSNVPWTATDDAAWLTLSPASGSNNGTLTASFSANTGTNARTATITATGGGITQTATLVQAGTGASCAAPTGLQTTEITQNTAKVSWGSVSGAVSYQLQFLIDGTWLNIGQPTTLTFTPLYGLMPNLSYSWRVITICPNNQQSVPSATATFSTPTVTNCPGGNQYPETALTPTANWQYQPQVYGGEYCLVNVQAGTTYTFSYCSSDGASLAFDGEISIRNTSDQLISYSNNFCGNAPKVIWQSNFNGQVRVLLTKYECLTQNTNSTLAYKIGNGFTGENEDRSALAPRLPLTLPGQTEHSRMKVSVFPNPTSGAFNIAIENIPVLDIDHIQVFDQLGRVMWSNNSAGLLVGSTYQIDAAAWAAGLYIVRAVAKDGSSAQQKIVVDHR